MLRRSVVAFAHLFDGRLARKSDLSVLTHLDALDVELVALRKNIFNLLDAMVSKLRDVNKSILTRQNLHKGTERHNLPYSTKVDLPDLGFDQTISDWLNNLYVHGVGRATTQVGDVTLQPGLRLGMAWDDFMTFQQTDTKNTYGPLVVTALQTGPEVAMSWNDKVFGHIGMNFSFANFTAYYALGLDMEIAYAFQDDLYAFFGSEFTRRSLGVYREQSGKNSQVGVVEDHFNGFQFGLGWQM